MLVSSGAAGAATCGTAAMAGLSVKDAIAPGHALAAAGAASATVLLSRWAAEVNEGGSAWRRGGEALTVSAGPGSLTRRLCLPQRPCREPAQARRVCATIPPPPLPRGRRCQTLPPLLSSCRFVDMRTSTADMIFDSITRLVSEQRLHPATEQPELSACISSRRLVARTPLRPAPLDQSVATASLPPAAGQQPAGAWRAGHAGAVADQLGA